MPAIVEATTLPTITAAAKGSEWTGYVNAYVLDARREQMVDGNYRQGLWYLSYVLPKGQGAVGQAIANTFFSNAGKKQIFLEGYGYITLGSHRQDLVKLGYKVHWNYRMETLGPDAIQCIIEPLMLTTFDPSASEGGSHHQKKGKGGKQNKGEASLSTAPSTQSFEDEEGDMTRREQKPMFLLLVPGHQKNDLEYRQALHWTYLRKRCPFDLCEEWAPFLWERAVREGEVKELEAWSYVYQPKAKDEDFTIPSTSSSSTSSKDVPPEPVEESPFQAVLSRAYLCLPNIEGIHASLVKHVNVTQDISEKVKVAA